MPIFTMTNKPTNEMNETNKITTITKIERKPTETQVWKFFWFAEALAGHQNSCNLQAMQYDYHFICYVKRVILSKYYLIPDLIN